jgi:hypothetical protein
MKNLPDGSASTKERDREFWTQVNEGNVINEVAKAYNGMGHGAEAGTTALSRQILARWSRVSREGGNVKRRTVVGA